MYAKSNHRLIAHNSARHQKVLNATRSGGTPPRFARFDDETAEAEEVVGDIRGRLDARGQERVRAGDIAVLFRTNEQPRAFEVEQTCEQIPVHVVWDVAAKLQFEVPDPCSCDA